MAKECGTPRAESVALDWHPCGATSRPKVGAFVHGQRPWLSAAGVNVQDFRRVNPLIGPWT
jgi:hypothetical protein